jgi:hypothetical protein
MAKRFRRSVVLEPLALRIVSTSSQETALCGAKIPILRGLQEMWMSLITPDSKTRVYNFGRGVSSLWIAVGLK